MDLTVGHIPQQAGRIAVIVLEQRELEVVAGLGAGGEVLLRLPKVGRPVL